MNPFDFVNAINQSKKDLMTSTGNDALAEKSYVPFIVNKALSYFPDTLLYANEINQLAHIDNKLQFHYLLNSIRPAKRFSKWAKKEDSDDLELIKEYYGYNNEKAYQALSILSKDQINYIKEQLEQGGIYESSRHSSRSKTQE